MDSRKLIAEAIETLRLEHPPELLAPHRYANVLKAIFEAHCQSGVRGMKRSWWWDDLKAPTAAAQPDDVFEVIKRLVPAEADIWLLVESNRDKRYGQYWVYQATLDVALAVLQECPMMEYYLVDRHLEWLLCENHHGVLCASGKPMTSRLRNACAQHLLAQRAAQA